MPSTKMFPGQSIGEKIILVLRRHPWNFVRTSCIYILLALIPLIINYIIKNYTEIVFSPAMVLNIKMLVCLYYFFIITFFYRAWLDHYLDIWVITSQRIVDIEQKGLFSRQIATQKLYRIQDVKTKVSGIIPTFLNYGDVFVQTAAAEPNFIFKRVPNPDKVSKKLMKVVNWRKKYMTD